MNSIRKRDYDADLERLKTFIDSYHNNDPETRKKGKILKIKFENFSWLKIIEFRTRGVNLHIVEKFHWYWYSMNRI